MPRCLSPHCTCALFSQAAVCTHCVCAVQVAWQCYPQHSSLEERLAACVDGFVSHVLPLATRVREGLDALRSAKVWRANALTQCTHSPLHACSLLTPVACALCVAQVEALFAHYEKEISAIFRCYAAANMEAGRLDSSTLDSLDLDELTYACHRARPQDAPRHLPCPAPAWGGPVLTMSFHTHPCPCPCNYMHAHMQVHAQGGQAHRRRAARLAAQADLHRGQSPHARGLKPTMPPFTTELRVCTLLTVYCLRCV